MANVIAASSVGWLRAGPIVVWACLFTCGLAFAAWAQQSPPPAANPPATAAPASEAAPQERPPEKKGFLDAVGRFIDKSASGIKDTFGGIGKSTTGVTRDAVDTIVKIPGTRVVEERAVCQKAANGAPDCKTAAETLCKSKGYSGGSSMDVQSAQKCSASAWLSGRSEGDCVVETYVTRSLCQ